ncbi:MAG TPA: ribose-phosphate pyrophosphokinase [Allosphingosinicella sp.]|nr:ribose-phosphate pyrophosphokinase [Allosphingosinicella sp.]
MAEPLADPAEVRAHLVVAAQAGVALSYGEILEHLGYRFSRPKMRQLCAMLGEIDRAAAARGEPELAVLVVRASDGLPGQGWWVAAEGGAARGYAGPWEGPEAARFIRGVQGETFAYWRSRSGTKAAATSR